MALRKPKNEATPQGGGVAVAEPPLQAATVAGESSEQCVAIGQALVQAGQLDTGQLASALEEANGDLLVLSSSLLTKHGVGRSELSNAIGAVCEVPLADSNPGALDEELLVKVAEEVARGHKVMPVA